MGFTYVEGRGFVFDDEAPPASRPVAEFCDVCERFVSVFRRPFASSRRDAGGEIWRDSAGKAWCAECWEREHPGVAWAP